MICWLSRTIATLRLSCRCRWLPLLDLSLRGSLGSTKKKIKFDLHFLRNFREFLKITHNIHRVWVANGVPLSYRHDSPLVVIFLEMNDTLDSPVDSKCALKNYSSIHVSRSHFKTFVVIKLIVSFELYFELIPRDLGPWYALRLCIGFLAEGFVWFHSGAMSEELRTKKCSVAWNVTVGNTLVFSVLTWV